MAERHTIAEMIGEGLREAGILIAVFGILDKFLRSETPTVTSTSSARTWLEMFDLLPLGCATFRNPPTSRHFNDQLGSNPLGLSNLET
jgi:hypothetical protein